jgi:hypothetical protein
MPVLIIAFKTLLHPITFPTYSPSLINRTFDYPLDIAQDLSYLTATVFLAYCVAGCKIIATLREQSLKATLQLHQPRERLGLLCVAG